MQWFTGLLAAALFIAAPASAQNNYPDKPIRIVVPFSAGSASDTVARVIAEEVRETFGTIVVENRQGANGIIGAGAVAKAAPDGYTLLLTSSATHSGIAAVVRQPGYDPLKDFVHISRIATIPMVLVVRADAPYATAQDLAAQSKKGALRFGYGSGSAQIAAATFGSVAGFGADAIPYKSQPAVVTDLLGGQIDYVMADTSVVTSFLQSRRLRGLAITSPQRPPELPDVPTMAQAGYPGFDLVVWVGLAAPAGTPAAIVERWNKAVGAALARPAVVDKLARLGMLASPNGVQEHAAFALAQRDVWLARAAKAGVEPQ